MSERAAAPGGEAASGPRLGYAPFDLLERGVGFAATMLSILGCYGASKLGVLGPYQLLPLTPLDEAIPYLPWTIWIYGTATWACVLAWAIVPTLLHARRLWATLALASVICCAVFIVWPTTYPRAAYPTPDDGSATALQLAELRADDTPANCLPSLHVALAFGLMLSGLSFPFRRRGARVGVGALSVTWCAAVCITTLTTKQHYLVDLPAGAAVGALSFWIARRALRHEVAPIWARFGRPLAMRDAADRAAIAKLRAQVEAHAWSLDELAWPSALEGEARAERTRPLDPLMERLLSEVIYIEEIARLNFELLRDASGDEDLRWLYDRFAQEERRHAEALTRVLELRGGTLRPPGLGNAMVLSIFDRLDPRSDADAMLVALSTPVFETFLDAGTIPFLRRHPELEGALMSELEARISRDEHAHIALNWIVTRAIARESSFRRGLRFLGNPLVYRGILAVPFMSLEVYALAARLGFDFATLLPPFRRLWRLHERFSELWRFPPWHVYRLFVACGVIASTSALWLSRAGLLFARFWTSLTLVLRAFARVAFGRSLLERHGVVLSPSARR